VRAVDVLKEKHLKLALQDGQHSIAALWWNAAEYGDRLAPTLRVNVLCKLEINEWNNRETCQLKVIDLSVE
jgi:hypothetical protein